MVAGYIEGHPILSIPNPHEADHPGLTDFNSASIVPMLRFYSYTFRTFVFFTLALVLISKPIFKLITIYGVHAPAIFQEKIGPLNFHFRSLSSELLDLSQIVHNSINENF